MHIGGSGDARKLAAGVKAVYDRIAQVRADQAGARGQSCARR